MPIAELFLSAVVKTLLSELATRVLSKYARINGISEKLNNLKLKLQTIQTAVDSAEERQKDGNPAYDCWLANLRDVAYDMEDLLDHFNVEAKRSAFKAQTKSGKLPSCLIACCSKIDPRTLLKDHRMANEIEEVDQRLEEVLQQKKILQFDENFRSSLPANSGQPRFTTTSLSEPKFVGREKHMEELLDQLTRIQETQDSDRPFTVLSIVGMGGLGKTTLAQQLYNHGSVSNAFKLKAWACVSTVFDSIAITKSVLQGVDPSLSCEGKDLNWLQNSLKQQLSEKKFLIVLDDVWTENYDELESFFKPFYSGSSGSRILLTTRNRQVAKNAGDRDPKELDLLSTHDCLSLLAYIAIGKDSFNSLPHLEDVAVKLAEKCKGLPLAVKTIGGLLRFESSDEKWWQVLDNSIWKGEGGEQEKIPPAMKLSYVYLPIHLKRCFAASALFPKDYVFEGDELTQMWIVQGLLSKGNAKAYRDVGMNYLDELADRSIFQKEGDKKTRYYMHHLINDLAKSVVGVTYFCSDENRKPSDEETLANIRHAAMVAVMNEKIPASKVCVYHSMKKLRTFMPFQTSTYPESNIWVSKKVLHDLIMGMKHLRILSFRYCCIREVPDLFGELKLLRSLDFSYTQVEVLPESICDLVKLQYLLLRGCLMLNKFPRNIQKLTNLLHLDITDAISLEEMPPHIGSLTNLEILSSFVVGKEAGQELKELGKLKCLQRELHIRNLLEVNNVEDAKIANINGKEGVSKLSLHWGLNVRISRHDEHQLELLNHLQPPRKIKSLGIHYYGGTKFPSWFDNSCMENVVSITLAGCKCVESLPPFGRLPSLESLNITELHAVSTIGDEFYGTPTPFRSLTSLGFCNMRAWEKWSSSGNCENDRPFPRLHKLTLQECPVLKLGLPGRLDSLFVLVIEDCPFLSASGDLRLPSLGKLHFRVCNDGLLKCLVETTCMVEMLISDVPQLIRFDGRFSSSWVALEELRIEGCLQFKSFEDEYGREQVPPKLKKLVIRNCADLERLPDDLSSLTSLNEVIVSGRHKLSSFPSVGLPPALGKVEIMDCPSLAASQFRNMRFLESLVEITLLNLEGLRSFEDVITGNHVSQSLRILSIHNCSSLTTIPDSLKHLSALSVLYVWDCEALELECFPALPCNLKVFMLSSCPKVKSLPQDMNNLTSLKHLKIYSCEGIKCLPRGGLPPNLKFLKVDSCRMMKQPLEEWGLAGLTSLEGFNIGGEMGCVDEIVSFPSSSVDAWRRLLPSSIVRLSISKMKKVERLSRGLRAHLSSLQELYICNCVEMRELPEEGLPDSLELFQIIRCDLLGERCKEVNGDYWKLIQLIPRVEINYRSVT